MMLPRWWSDPVHAGAEAAQTEADDVTNPFAVLTPSSIASFLYSRAPSAYMSPHDSMPFVPSR